MLTSHWLQGWIGINGVTGPVIHIGISAALAFVLRLNPVITILCGILPDVVDAPLAVLGIGGGRYIGHTLLFAIIVIAVFVLWKRKYGLAAFIGLLSHLLLDLNALVPWLYPFKNYNFSNEKIDLYQWFKDYFDFSRVGHEIIIILLVALFALISWWLYKRYIKRKKHAG